MAYIQQVYMEFHVRFGPTLLMSDRGTQQTTVLSAIACLVVVLRSFVHFSQYQRLCHLVAVYSLVCSSQTPHQAQDAHPVRRCGAQLLCNSRAVSNIRLEIPRRWSSSASV